MSRGKQALYLMACSMCTALLMALWPIRSILCVETAVVGSGELVESLLFTGTVQYARQQPCISLKSGLVSQVHVAAGQQVKSGQLLFSLDTSVEQQALAELYAQKQAQQLLLADLDTAAAAFAVQSQLDMETRERELIAAVEASSIRAVSDGVVQVVYTQPGDLVTETAVMGIVRGNELQISAAASAADASVLSVGAAASAKANGKEQETLLLSGIRAGDAAGMQILTFQFLEEHEWSDGEAVEVELITGIHPADALIPLAAIGLDNRVWYIEQGRAYSEMLEISAYNQSYAAASQEWKGKSVILWPEQYELSEGLHVRSAGKQ